MSKKSHSKNSMIPLLLIGAGVAAVIASRPRPRPVDGLGEVGLGKSWGRSIGRSFSRVTHSVSRSVKKTTRAAKRAASPIRKGVKKAAKIVKKVGLVAAIPGVMLPLKLGQKVLGKVMEGRGGGGVEEVQGPPIYQDENGNVISEAEFKRREAEQLAPPIQGGTWQQQIAQETQGKSWEQLQREDLPNRSGGGGAPASYAPEQNVLPPVAQTPVPTSADMAAPAPAGKINPLVTAAALISVPVLMLATGGK